MKRLLTLVLLLGCVSLAWGQAQLINGSRVLTGWINAGDATGSGGNYVLTLTPAITQYVHNQCFLFRANHANAGAATLNVNGAGSRTIKKYVSGAATDLAANDIGTNQQVHVCYDFPNTVMQLQSGAPAPAAGGGSGDITDVGSCATGACGTSGGTRLLSMYWTPIAPPAAPSAPGGVTFFDTTNKVWVALNDAGTQTHTIRSCTLEADKWIQSIDDAGVCTKNPVPISGLSGRITVAQLPLKITDTPIKPREVPFTGTSPVINSDSTDTATGTISGSTTFQIPSGTPDPSQILALRMTSITTPQTLNWVTTTGGFSSNGNIPLPTQTTGTNIEDHLIFKWNAPPVSRWVLIGTNMIPSAVQRHLTVIAATCLGASAVAELDLPSSNAPTANCITGSTNQHDATLDFADSANQSAEFPIQFPVGWTGTLDVDWWWLVTASGGSNAVNWNFAVICQTSGTTYDQSYPSPGTTVTTNVGATNAWVKSTQTSIPVAGCAAGSRGKVRVQRLVADTFTGTARLNMLFLTMRVIPQS